MINKKDISVIIQGPLDSLSINNLDVYKDFGEIIISSWVDSDLGKLATAPKVPFKVVINDYPNIENFFNFGNITWECMSTIKGLKEVTKPFCFKTRADELYPNLDVYVESLNKDPDKIHSSNQSFCKDSYMKYHASTHLLLAKSDVLLKAFDHSLILCLDNKDRVSNRIHYTTRDGVKMPIHAERIVTVSTLVALGYKLEDLVPEKSIEIMKKHYKVIPLKAMSKFFVSANSSKANPSAPYIYKLTRDIWSSNPQFCSDIEQL